MSLLDGPLRAAAKKLIGLAGAPATIRVVTSSYDPASLLENEDTATYSLRISPPEPYRAHRIDGTQVLAGDAACLVAARDLEAVGLLLPTGSLKNVYLTLGADEWQVVAVNHIRSGEQIAAVELQLRR